MPHFIGIIPARYASTRFPGKPLAEIKGKSMIQRVYLRAAKAGLNDLYVATNNDSIFKHVVDFGGKCLLTSASHGSGTDRCNESASLLNLRPEDVIINIQGDEPFIHPEQIQILCACFEDIHTHIATLIKSISELHELQNVTIPKVVINKDQNAIYFSRSIIPFANAEKAQQILSQKQYFKHIGIYAYRVKTLREIASLKPSFLEQAESLEQLRWIENGYPIKTVQTSLQTIAIDTPADLAQAIQWLENNTTDVEE